MSRGTVISDLATSPHILITGTVIPKTASGSCAVKRPGPVFFRQLLTG
jgi:hypothetical protein